MFFKKKMTLEVPTSVEQLRLSSEDLFCLLGGEDTTLTATSSFELNYDYIEKKRPQDDIWKQNLINRFKDSGWVDAEGKPNALLERTLAPLCSCGLATCIINSLGRPYVGVGILDNQATGIVRASGFRGGWFLKPFPENRSAWSRFFLDDLLEGKYPFKPAAFDAHVAYVEQSEDDICEAMSAKKKKYIAEYAKRYGLLIEPFMQIMKIGRKTADYEAVTVDYSNCEPDMSRGFRYFASTRGNVQERRSMVFSSLGATISDCDARHGDMPDDWQLTHENFTKYRAEASFISFDFNKSGDLFETLAQTFSYPEDPVVIFHDSVHAL